jgi:hypothetical protein
MTVRALARLYAGELPVRGEIEVILRDGAAEGTTGVVANVASLLTGAAQEGGFKGIAGRFDRRHLLSFGGAIGAEIAFRRRDTGAVVGAAFDATIVPFEPAARALLQLLMAGGAGAAEAAEFRHLWQDRVRRILIDHAEDPRLVLLSRPAAAADAPAPHH